MPLLAAATHDCLSKPPACTLKRLHNSHVVNLPPVTTAVVSGLHHFCEPAGILKPKVSACADPIRKTERSVPKAVARSTRLLLSETGPSARTGNACPDSLQQEKYLQGDQIKILAGCRYAACNADPSQNAYFRKLGVRVPKQADPLTDTACMLLAIGANGMAFVLLWSAWGDVAQSVSARALCICYFSKTAGNLLFAPGQVPMELAIPHWRY